MCPACSCLDHYDISTRRHFKYARCGKQFSVTNGAIFASRKLSFINLRAVVAIFVDEVNGLTPLQLKDGRALSESNAIIGYLARGSALIPADEFARAKMQQWLFWEQYSHEPYIAVRRFQRLYLGKPEAEIDPKLSERGHAALALMEKTLASQPFFVGAALSLADVALVAYTRLAHEGGFDLAPYPGIRAWIARVEGVLRIVD